MRHSRNMAGRNACLAPQGAAQPHEPGARPRADGQRHARLFEMIRQQDLAERALLRLHRRDQAGADLPVPQPAALAASLLDQSAVRPS